jgi:hypothetical protein
MYTSDNSWCRSYDRPRPLWSSEEQGRSPSSFVPDWNIWCCIYASARLECFVRFLILDSVPITNIITSRNIAGHSKKVTANALTLVAFAVGNILGTQTFQAKEAPGYISGKISIAATLGALCFIILLLRWHNDHLNRKNERILVDMNEAEKDELREKMAFADQTDRKNPFFRYTH